VDPLAVFGHLIPTPNCYSTLLEPSHLHQNPWELLLHRTYTVSLQQLPLVHSLNTLQNTTSVCTQTMQGSKAKCEQTQQNCRQEDEDQTLRTHTVMVEPSRHTLFSSTRKKYLFLKNIHYIYFFLILFPFLIYNFFYSVVYFTFPFKKIHDYSMDITELYSCTVFHLPSAHTLLPIFLPPYCLLFLLPNF
jgi:hypothetical protein